MLKCASLPLDLKQIENALDIVLGDNKELNTGLLSEQQPFLELILIAARQGVKPGEFQEALNENLRPISALSQT